MRTIPEFENYMVSPDGRIYSKIRNRYLTGSPNSKGYLKVGLRRNEEKSVIEINFEEIEIRDQVNRGNVCYSPIGEAYAEES